MKTTEGQLEQMLACLDAAIAEDEDSRWESEYLEERLAQWRDIRAAVLREAQMRRIIISVWLALETEAHPQADKLYELLEEKPEK